MGGVEADRPARSSPQLRELARVRNAAARDLGWSSYYSMSLELDELDENEVFETLDAVLAGSQESYERYKARLDTGLAERFGVAVEELRPWHYARPVLPGGAGRGPRPRSLVRGSVAREIATEYFDEVGFDVRPILARSDLYERENKCQHAFCADIDRKGDVRILCNLTPTEYWAATLLHELGHGVYDDGIDPALPYFPAHCRAPDHDRGLGDAVRAPLPLGRMARALRGHAGGRGCDGRAMLDARDVAQHLYLARWVPVMAYFERALYRDPSRI